MTLEATSVPVSENHPHVFILRNSDGSRIVLKKRKLKTTVIRRILNLFYFKRETQIMAKLHDHPFRHLCIPRLIDTDERSFMLLEYLDGVFLKNCAIDFSCGEIGKGLVELHLFRSERYIGPCARLIQRYITTTGLSIHRGAALVALAERRPLIFLKVIKTFYTCLRSAPRQKTYFFHHRDLINHDNSFVMNDGRLALIDFGNARAERRWILMDAIDLSIDYDMNVNAELLRSCLQQILPLCTNPIAIRDHVRISLIRRLLHPARLTARREFLSEILLDDSKFQSWYEEHVMM